MKERGILFSGEMVRALLDGRKTQTRRIIKFPRWADPASGILFLDGNPSPMVVESGFSHWRQLPAPYAVGDVLWVREAADYKNLGGSLVSVVYDADGFERTIDNCGAAFMATTWKRSRKNALYMPRWASRITLEVTAVRAERLQDISEEDANAEGVEAAPAHGEWCDPALGRMGHWSYRKAYAQLWDSINGPGSWERNDWVWVYGLRRVEC